MFCLFVRFLPMVATAEVKTVLPEADPHGHSGGHAHGAVSAHGEPAVGGAS
jgi:molybdopterin-containing oxidoreductase family membrane subunit